MAGMTLKLARLHDRALIRLDGPDWRSFLQGLITQDVERLAVGELRYGALLTPQGRLLYDLFLWGGLEGGVLDVQADSREALVARLKMHRLRAKVGIEPRDGAVFALFGGDVAAGLDPDWRSDPRLQALGWRAFGEAAPAAAAEPAPPEAYDAHRLALGVPDLVRDALADKAYAVEANFDVLAGVDFKKGCFVGQETTSRMKRRGQVKTRLVPLAFQGEPPPPGAEVLAGVLRAGVVCSGIDGRALALMRLDRARDAALTVEGRAVRLDPPSWLAPVITSAIAEAATEQA